MDLKGQIRYSELLNANNKLYPNQYVIAVKPNLDEKSAHRKCKVLETQCMLPLMHPTHHLFIKTLT